MLTANSRNKTAALGNFVVTVKSAETYGQLFNEVAKYCDTNDDCRKSIRTTTTTTTCLCWNLNLHEVRHNDDRKEQLHVKIPNGKIPHVT